MAKRASELPPPAKTGGKNPMSVPKGHSPNGSVIPPSQLTVVKKTPMQEEDPTGVAKRANSAAQSTPPPQQHNGHGIGSNSGKKM
jgi:hypothetical protein